jgi:hypothetical protein
MTVTLNKTLKNREVVCDETENRVQCIGTKIFALLGCYTVLTQVSGRRVRPIFKGQAGGLLDP